VSFARFLSLLFAAAPFAFGLVRYFSTGSDLRMLWMALAAFLGLVLVRVFARRRSQTRSEMPAFSGLTFIVATLLAAATARLLGATAAAGIWGVAIVFGILCATSYALDAVSRPRTI